MKKFSVIVATLAVAILFATSIAKANVNACSTTGIINPDKSRVEVISDPALKFIVVTIVATDENGVPVCGALISLTTTRNQYLPANQPDEIWFRTTKWSENGKAIFIISSHEAPGGDTLLVDASGKHLTHEFPFSWGEHFNTSL